DDGANAHPALRHGDGPEPSGRYGSDRDRAVAIIAALSRAFPVPPEGDILEYLMKRAIPEVVCRHKPVSPGGVDKVVEEDLSAQRGVVQRLPARLAGPALPVELDGLDLGALVDAHPLCARVLEEQVIEVRALDLEAVDVIS